MSKLPFNQGQPQFIPLTSFIRYPEAEMLARSQAFYADIKRRKTIREFSAQPVPRQVIETACSPPAPRRPAPTTSPGISWWWPTRR
ncbi:hypothetical protein [Chromobacterium sphagni]|uniref:hypothetical protein n=1 Tax=Chromobacterium sphagni TaxID=1903179 RepID=UPI001F4E07B6|nr:hypothetical protein [Chromobacterium sphagni]